MISSRLTKLIQFVQDEIRSHKCGVKKMMRKHRAEFQAIAETVLREVETKMKQIVASDLDPMVKVFPYQHMAADVYIRYKTLIKALIYQNGYKITEKEIGALCDNLSKATSMLVMETIQEGGEWKIYKGTFLPKHEVK